MKAEQEYMRLIGEVDPAKAGQMMMLQAQKAMFPMQNGLRTGMKPLGTSFITDAFDPKRRAITNTPSVDLMGGKEKTCTAEFQMLIIFDLHKINLLMPINIKYIRKRLILFRFPNSDGDGQRHEHVSKKLRTGN